MSCYAMENDGQVQMYFLMYYIWVRIWSCSIRQRQNFLTDEPVSNSLKWIHIITFLTFVIRSTLAICVLNSKTLTTNHFATNRRKLWSSTLHFERQRFRRHFVWNWSYLAKIKLKEMFSIDVHKTDKRLKFYHSNAHCRTLCTSGDIWGWTNTKLHVTECNV